MGMAMFKKSKFRLILSVLALAAGLVGAVYLLAAAPDKVRPKDSPKRVAFAAPSKTGPQPAHYEAQVRNLRKDTEELIGPLTFTTVAGPVDSDVVWIKLEHWYEYQARVRGVAAGGAAGQWSVWSDSYYHPSPDEIPGDQPE